MRDLAICARELGIRADDEIVDRLVEFLAQHARHMDVLKLFDVSRILHLKPVYDYATRRICRLDLAHIVSLDSFDQLTLSSMYDLVKLESLLLEKSVDDLHQRRRFAQRVLTWMCSNSRHFDIYTPQERRALIVRFLRKLRFDRHFIEIFNFSTSSQQNSFLAEIKCHLAEAQERERTHHCHQQPQT